MTSKTRRTLRTVYDMPEGCIMTFDPFLPPDHHEEELRAMMEDGPWVRMTYDAPRFCNPPGHCFRDGEGFDYAGKPEASR